MFDIDYREYLSIDNGNGLLFSKYEVSVLEKYGFLVCEYNSYGSLIFDVNDYLDSCVDDCDDLEDVLISISEKNYYYNVNK